MNSFKFFLAYKGALQVSDEEFLEGLARCKELGAIPQASPVSVIHTSCMLSSIPHPY